MLPATLPLALYRGDTYAWRFTLYADDAKTQPADLTGVTAKAEIRAFTGATPAIAMACVVTLPNIIDVKLPANAWSPMTLAKSGVAIWDLQLTYSSGEVKTIIRGDVTITGDITDSVPVTTTRVRQVQQREPADQ